MPLMMTGNDKGKGQDMDRVAEIVQELSREVTDETVEAECRMMTVLATSFMEDLITASDIVRFGQTLGSSPEGRTHYMLGELDWEGFRTDLLQTINRWTNIILSAQSPAEKERDFSFGLWVKMKFYGLMLEAIPDRSVSNWLDDPFLMSDWVVKQLLDWEARSGGYDQEGDRARDEEIEWYSTAERVLDIPSSELPIFLKKAFALGAASLWGEG